MVECEDADGEALARWAVLGRAWLPDVYADQTVTLDAPREHITFYSPDVTGSPRVAQYAHDPKTFDGFVLPTRRRVHRHDTGGIANQSFAAITVDIQSIAVGQT
jgi:hypothetical protein